MEGSSSVSKSRGAYRNEGMVGVPTKADVKKELKGLAKHIQKEILGDNVKHEKLREAKRLVNQIKRIIKEDNDEFLTSNTTLALIKNIDTRVNEILIKQHK